MTSDKETFLAKLCVRVGFVHTGRFTEITIKRFTLLQKFLPAKREGQDRD